MPHLVLTAAAVLAMHAPASGDASAEYDLRRWTKAEGLPQSSVNSIVESRDGHLWLGTFGGLVKFDGHRFVVFSIGTHEGLGSDRIVSLHEDRAGAVWIGHEGEGVTRFSAGRFTHFPPDDAIPAKEIWTIAEDAQGHVWVGGDGVARWDGERFQRVELPSDSEWSVTWSIVADPHDGVWATTNSGLWRVDARGSRLIPHDLTLSSTHWRWWQLHRDPQDRIWLQTPEALHEVRDEALIPRSAGGTYAGAVRDMLVDRRGQWWMAGHGGLFRSGVPTDLADASWHEVDGIDDEAVRSVLEDRDGNIWIGTDQKGLFCAAPRHHRTHTWAELGQVGRFRLTGHGPRLWSIRSWPKPTARRFSGGEVDRSLDLAALGIYNVGAALAIDDDTLWLADRDAVVRVRNGDAQRYRHTLESTPTAMIQHDGDLWCGGAGYIGRFDGQRVDVVATFETAPDEAVRRFTRDDAGRLWFITEHALYRWAGDRLTVFNHEMGIPRSLRALATDSNGDVWVGGYGSGLARLRGGSLLSLTTNEGLADNAISFISIERGLLWANTNRGVFRITLDQVDAWARGEIDLLRCSRFDVGEANQREGWHAEDGTLYLPTVTGVVAMNTKELLPPPAPPVHVEAVTVGTRAYAATAPIELPPGERSFSIRYSAPRPASAGQIRFRYRISGHDEAWSSTSDSREAVFWKLPAGAYRFEVVAGEGDGPWSRPPAGLALTLLPFFYETWWFQAVTIGVGAVALILVHRLRVARARASERRMSNRLVAAQETERRRIGLELHDDLSQRLAALGLTVSSLSRDDESPDLVRVAHEIRQLAADLHSMSRQLHPSVLTNLGFAEAVQSECRSFSARTGLGTEVRVDGEFTALSEQRALALFRILQEALRNVQKHAGSPSVKIDLRAEAGEVCLRVTDAGRGFDSAAKRGRGLGLRGIEERARLAGGSSTVDSRVGEGTMVEVRLPWKRRKQ